MRIFYLQSAQKVEGGIEQILTKKRAEMSARFSLCKKQLRR